MAWGEFDLSTMVGNGSVSVFLRLLKWEINPEVGSLPHLKWRGQPLDVISEGHQERAWKKENTPVLLKSKKRVLFGVKKATQTSSQAQCFHLAVKCTLRQSDWNCCYSISEKSALLCYFNTNQIHKHILETYISAQFPPLLPKNNSCLLCISPWTSK